MTTTQCRIKIAVKSPRGWGEDDRYCVDILVQLASVRASINKIGLSILESHTRGCVSRAIQEGKGEEQIEELIDVLSRFVK